MEVITHNYVYDEKASDSSKIVTICACCGDAKVKMILPEIDQMEQWTLPPKQWMPKTCVLPGRSLSPRRFD